MIILFFFIILSPCTLITILLFFIFSPLHQSIFFWMSIYSRFISHVWRSRSLKLCLFISDIPSSEAVLQKHWEQQSVGYYIFLSFQRSELAASQSIPWCTKILQRVNKRRDLCLGKLKHGSHRVVFSVAFPGNWHKIINPFCRVHTSKMSKNCQLKP